MDAHWAVFGMSRDQFKTRHSNDGHSDEALGSAFEKHDEDNNDKLFKAEYLAALAHLKSEV